MYYIEKNLVRLILLFFTSFRVQGKENIPKQGSLLIVANHLNIADPPILGSVLGRRMVFMAKEELFKNWFFAFFIRHFGAFPVSRGRADLGALRYSERVLAAGGVLMMFPEGKRSRGRLQEGQLGSALIAHRNQVPILPVGISGTERIHGLGWLFQRPQINLVIGRPFNLPDTDHNVTREQLAGSTETIMRNIAGLLPVQYRGEYGERLIKCQSK